MESITERCLAQLRHEKVHDLDEGFDTIGWETTEDYVLGEISIPSTFGFGEQWAQDVITSITEVLNYLQ